MKAYKVNNLVTPYKAHAFIVANGNEDLILETQTHDIDSQFCMVDDGMLVFNWELDNENINHEIELEVEIGTGLEHYNDFYNNDVQEITTLQAEFEYIKIEGLTYYDIDQMISDLGSEIGYKIKSHIETLIEIKNDEL